MRILSWNVNGLRAAHKKGFLDWLLNEKPDVLCIQELRAMEEQLPLDVKEIEGYYSYFCSAERKGYSGVALYTNIEPQSVTRGFGVERFDREGRTLMADYGDFVLLSVYFPNGGSSEERFQYKLEFYEAFLDHVEGLREQGRQIVICGDVNTAHKEIDLAEPEKHKNVSGFLPEERAWIDKLLDKGYIDTFRMFNDEPGHYTWWDYKVRSRQRNLGWRIDYFFVSDGFKSSVESAYILSDVMGSDHCPIGIDISIST